MTEDEEKVARPWYKDIIDMCPVLFCQHDKSMQETCMCWGFECGKGWEQPLRDLSYELEALNMYYWKKYRVRIQADQVKEKYGTLRFYTSTIVDPPAIVRCIKGAIYYIGRKFDNKFNMHAKFKYDAATHTSVRIEPNANCVVKALHNMIWFAHSFMTLFIPDITREQELVRDMLDNKANELVQKAEERCTHFCEQCGHQIGTSWSKACQTEGWITYICKDCADKQECNYIMDGERWKAGKKIVQKEASNEDEQSCQADD